jgi:hypothetical protein
MWNQETEEQMKKFIQIVETKKHINGTEITILYNLIFNKNLKPTNCSSCVSLRYKELKTSYDNHLKQKEMALRVIDQLMMEGIIPEGAAVATNITDEITITTKKGRPKKKD